MLPVTESARGTNSVAPPMTDHDYSSSSNQKSPAANAPMVLIRNCSDIELEAETDPANQADVVWKVEANPGPNAPATVLTPAGTMATLKTEASGGYAISACLDGTTVYWNIVLVELKILPSSEEWR